MSKLTTVFRLISSGEFRTFTRLVKNNTLSTLIGSRLVRIGDVKFRLLAKAEAEISIASDERELRLLSLVPKRRMKCVYDIGANVGLHSLYYSFFSDNVVAFEPAPDNFARLLKNIEMNRRPNIRPMNIALSASSGRAMFWDDGISQTSRLVDTPGQTVGKRQIEVETRRLDDLTMLPPPDLIKIDVEGAEMSVLRGAGQCLSRHRPEILLEVHRNMGVSEAEVEAYLSDLGYSLSRFRKDGEAHYVCHCSH